eukprot:3759075-Karenia_brevis.AAC.1
MDPDDLPEVPLEDSPGSIKGQQYLGAGKEKIKNVGQKKFTIELQNGGKRRVTFQAAAVRKPLLAVSGACDLGQFCFFDNEGSYICRRDSPIA